LRPCCRPCGSSRNPDRSSSRPSLRRDQCREGAGSMSPLEIVFRILPTVPVAALTWLRRPKSLVPSRHGGFWADRPDRRNRHFLRDLCGHARHPEPAAGGLARHFAREDDRGRLNGVRPDRREPVHDRRTGRRDPDRAAGFCRVSRAALAKPARARARLRDDVGAAARLVPDRTPDGPEELEVCPGRLQDRKTDRLAAGGPDRVVHRCADYGGRLVRSFLFGGWSNSFLSPAGAILLSLAVWA
jgi:hypothetical protein